MNDLDLIRQFRSEMPDPDSERTAVARAGLEAAALREGRPGRRRPVRGRARRPARLVTMIGVPAVAAVAFALLIVGNVGGGGAGIADAAILHRVDAALALPPNEILHTKLEGGGSVAETWQLTSAPYSMLAYKGPIGADNPEVATNGTSSSYYDPATNTIHELPSTKSFWRTGPDDPIAQVRAALQTGQARVIGASAVDGVQTYGIQFQDKGGFDSQSLVVYVDQNTYRPILVADPQRDGTIVNLRVVALEYLPVTASNLRDLSLVAQYPGARVVTDSSPVSTGGPGK